MKLPNFLIIGAAKAGTTALYQYLKQHPQIFASPIKEPHFFGLEGEQIEFQGPEGIKAKENSSIRNLEEYCNLFKNAPTNSYSFEASVSYLYLPKAAHRIKYYIPDVKLIVIIRNPIDRAFSSFLYLMRDSREPLLDFKKGLEAEVERINNNWSLLYHYINMGFYAKQLKLYFQLFDSEQIKIYLYDDLQSDTLKVIKDIFKYISVDENFHPDISKAFNVSGMPKNKLIHRLIDENSLFKSFLKKFIPRSVRYSLKESYYERNLIKPILKPQIRHSLLEVFRTDILETQDLIRRDLSNWLV